MLGPEFLGNAHIISKVISYSIDLPPNTYMLSTVLDSEAEVRYNQLPLEILYLI